MNGFIKVHRRIVDHWLWEYPDGFRAFVDLVLMAEWKPKQRIVGGRLISLDRGQLVASLRFLAGRWNWKKDHVRRFISKLEQDGIVRHETRQRISVVTICKYDHYQSRFSEDETCDETLTRQPRDTDATTPRQPRDKLEEGKEPLGSLSIARAEDDAEAARSGAPLCSLPQALAFANENAITDEVATKWWNDLESIGWINQHGHPIRKWQNHLIRWAMTHKSNEARYGTNGNSKQPQRGSLRTGDQSDADRYAPGRNGLEGFDTESPLR